MNRFVALLVISFALISGCTLNIQSESYQDQTPEFELFDFFSKPVTAWGIVQDRRGNLVQRFKVDIVGSLTGENTIMLDETFHYLQGEGPEKRIWTINRNTDGSYQGSASDIEGIATGNISGNSLKWAYGMKLPVGSREIEVKFEDWMWMLDESRLINRSYIKKFGIVVAEVTIYMESLEGS